MYRKRTARVIVRSKPVGRQWVLKWHVSCAGEGMIQDYCKTVYRALVRNRNHTLLHIVGLAVGTGACLLIFLLVQFELSFDDWHPNKDRIYRLVTVPFRAGSPLGAEAGVPLPVARGLRLDFPQLEQVASIFGRDGQVTVIEDNQTRGKKFEEEGDVFFAEPEFFDIFRFGWLSGDPRTALSSPNSVVLSRTIADTYFGNWKKAVGRTIQFDNASFYHVTGILEDVPANSDFPLKVVISYLALKNVDMNDWQGVYGRGYTFVRLPHGFSVGRMNAALHDFVNRHTPVGAERRGIELQRLADMHFDARFGTFSGRTFSKRLITSLCLTAALLLIIACVNFINLATALAVRRSREMGIRKVLGSTRGQLIRQFLGEAAGITLVAVSVALYFSALALPPLNRLLNTDIQLRMGNGALIGFLGALVLAVTAMAGIYPSFVLSGSSAAVSLKNKVTRPTTGALSLRRGLTVLQCCIAQVLIVCVLVVSGQMHFFKNTPLGFDKASILTVPIPNDSLSQLKMDAVRLNLLQVPGIRSVCFSTFSPLDNEIWSNQFKFDHSRTKTDFQAYFKWADAGFFSTYHPELVAGRTYGPSDTLREFIVNETLVKKLGFRHPGDILGKEINFWDQERAPVVGVVKDFQTGSLQTPIKPIVIGAWKQAYAMAGIKLVPDEAGRVLPAIGRIWKNAYPDYVYSYQFLDDKIDSYYKEEGKLSVLYRVFAGIAILLSCLGLYSLVSFMAAQRVREIGVRKVLGASVTRIVVLLSYEFVPLVGIAFVLAAPVGYYLMHRWLDEFANRIKLGPGLFLLSIGISLLIAWCTVGYRAFRAATANPIRTLRSE